MKIKVRYLSEDQIEKEAELLLAEYAETAGGPIRLPVPVEDITTYHLALRLGFADLHETLRIPMLRDQPDILGAIWIDKEAVLIDESLDPNRYPSMRGRYRFSVGHEIGHWRLHRAYVANDANQASLFDATSEPTVICRSSQAKEPIEWQADLYSSCVLMPRAMVFEEWAERFGSASNVIMTEDVRRTYVESDHRSIARRRFSGLSHAELDDYVVAPFAENFQVSKQAMRIRLEKLGLLNRDVPRQRHLTGLG